MLRPVKRPSIAIIGAGRLGTALAFCLKRCGYSINEVVARQRNTSSASARRLAREVGASASSRTTARFDADLVWFCVPDSKIAQVALEFSDDDWKGKIALHSSGVLPSDTLLPLRKRGASVASAHPLMTFVKASVPNLSGVMFAAEGDAPALPVVRRIVRDMGGEMVVLRKRDKAAYHAFATMVCPLFLSLLACAEEAAGLAEISRQQARRRVLPIIRQTLWNYSEWGLAKSFTGPIVRGDARTIGLHLDALAKTAAARDAYIALANAAVKYLPSKNRQQLEAMLRKSNS
jgi:predicted short-subunit dehydrogenase-like oxidoreductase (DUF2520 family)